MLANPLSANSASDTKRTRSSVSDQSPSILNEATQFSGAHTPSRPLKALVVIARAWPALGGAQIHTRYMCQALREHGVQSHVLSHCSDQDVNNELAICQAPNMSIDDSGTSISQVPVSGKAKGIISLLAGLYPTYKLTRPLFNYLVRQFSRNEISLQATQSDLIHNVYCGLTMVSEAACASAKKLNKPFVFSPLARTCDGDKSAWSSARMKRIYAQSDAIVALTEHEKKWLITQGVEAAKIHVCPMASVLSKHIDGQAFRKQYALENQPFVLFLGRHDHDKGYHAVLAAAREVWKTQPDMHFVFFGPQTSESRQDFQENNDPRIHAIESPSQKLKSAALSECELLCVPSIKESLGVVYLEAWQMSKPVIAGDIPLLRELVEDAQGGLLSSQDPSKLAEAINTLLSDPALKAEMGRNGFNKVQQQYTWPVVSEKLARIFQEAIVAHASSALAETLA